MAKEWSLEHYQHAISEVTNSFQSLSKEVIVTMQEFRESGLSEAAGILEQLQGAEKEKLELVVRSQVLSQHEREREETSEEVEDFGAAKQKMTELRKE